MIIKRLTLYQKFNKELQTKKAIYIYGPTGWGKTTAVLDWLESESKKYTYISANQEDFPETLTNELNDIIVIDNIQSVNDFQMQQLILSKMNSNNLCHFVFIGRCELPSFLKPYELISQLTCFDYTFLQFDREMTDELLSSYKLNDPTYPSKIENATQGYPMAIFFLIKRLSKGEPMNTQTINRMKLDMFDCYDELVFKRWDSDMQKFMLQMATFEIFSEKMAGMVTGNNHIISIIEKALYDGSYLVPESPDTYSIHHVFRNFLLQKQHSICSEKFMSNIYHNAALYFELEDDIKHALYYYNLCNDIDKLEKLLVINSNLHPGNGHYYETEQYYRALPKEVIQSSPDLMCGMCMLCSLCFQLEESEYWYSQLEKYEKHHSIQSGDYKKIHGKLLYLKIALPHRGSKRIATILFDVAKAYHSGEFHLQEFSVTSNLPSVLSGGKDFCSWMRHDRKLYSLMKKPIELILGKYGVGLADIGLAESLFEKSLSNNLTEIMMLLNSGQNAAAFKGTLEIEFVAVGILCRAMLMENNLSSAYALLESIESRAQSVKMPEIVSNIKAMRTVFALMEGKLGQSKSWLLNDSPDETKQFHILDRYRYLTKVRCYLSLGKYADALSLLGKLMDYFKSYNRTYNQLEAEILLAITQYNMGQDGWQKTLNDTLEKCEHYGFIRFVAEEGISLMPLFQKNTFTVSNDYRKKIVEETKHYALLYPTYQKPIQQFTEPLTKAEKTVLQLISKGLSNQEIAQLMDVSLRTVKFHTGNLYTKMKVKNRVQATKKAFELL